jgi:hypothetical protein
MGTPLAKTHRVGEFDMAWTFGGLAAATQAEQALFWFAVVVVFFAVMAILARRAGSARGAG